MMLASRIYDSLDYYYKLSQGVITILLAIVALERFSNDCRKTKTKVITQTNHRRNKTQNKPIRNRSKYK